MPALCFTIVVLLAHCLHTCLAQSSNNYFENPPAASANEVLSTNLVWAVGSSQTLTWFTSDNNAYDIDLWYNNVGNGVQRMGNIQSYPAQSTGHRTYTWSVDAMGGPLPAVYFIWLNDTSKPGYNGLGFTSHYFNLTAAGSSSSSSSSTSSSTLTSTTVSSSSTQASSTPTVSSSTGSSSAPTGSPTPTSTNTPASTPAPTTSNNSLAIGLGVGLGVGVVVLLGAVAWLLARHFKNKVSSGGPNHGEGGWTEKMGNPGVVNYSEVDGTPRAAGPGASYYDTKPKMSPPEFPTGPIHYPVELSGTQHPVELGTRD